MTKRPENAHKALQSLGECGTKKNGPGDVTSAIPTLDIGHCEGVTAMPVEALISPKGDSASKSNIAPIAPAKWQSIGDLARVLAEKAGGGK